MKIKHHEPLPIEQLAREEAAEAQYRWNQGPFKFFLQRVNGVYQRRSVQARRQMLESEAQLDFPPIDDRLLMALYEHACAKYMYSCRERHTSSGFLKTRSEKQFLENLEAVLKNHPQLRYIEIYPSRSHSKDLYPGMKMVVGNYVPDFLLFGIKKDNASAVAIEIDGDSHISKFSKDSLRQDHLIEMKIFSFSIQNHQVNDITYIKRILENMYRFRSGGLDKQVLRAKRMIWTKTISCHMDLTEIEEFALSRLGIQLNLLAEADLLRSLRSCPRKIKKELIYRCTQRNKRKQ